MPNLRSVPFIIGVAGGTASGKSSVCSRIIQRLTAAGVHKRVVSISQDSFYRNLETREELEKARRGDFNFDHPDAFEQSLMLSVLRELKKGNSVQIPKYDFVNNCRVIGESETIGSADVVLVEGILVFFDADLRDIFNLKLFVDADPDIRLARRVERDTKERGRPLDHVLHQYLKLVKPAFEEFCLPTKKYADMILPRGADNDVGIDLIVQHIQEILRSPPPRSINSTTEDDPSSGRAKDTDDSTATRSNCSSATTKKSSIGSYFSSSNGSIGGGGDASHDYHRSKRPH